MPVSSGKLAGYAPTMKAAIYLRVSLDRTGERAAVDRQEAECRLLCAALGLEVGELYIDNDISATSGKARPRFEAMLRDRPAAIVTWHMDRLVRLSKDLERVLDLGVNVHTVASGQVDLSHPAGRATAKTLVAWAQYEGEQKAERQKASHRQRRAQGRVWWNRRPFGYTQQAEIVEDEAEMLGAVYRGVAAGETNLTAWARRLNQAGHTGTRGANWTSPNLRAVLLAERNAGGPTWEPVVDEATYRRVREILTSGTRPGGKPRVGLLTGLGRCSVCKGPVGVVTLVNRPGVSYYGCRAGKHFSTPRLPVEEMIDARVVAVLAEPEFLAKWGVKTPADLDAARREITAVDVLLVELAEDYADPTHPMTRAQFRAATEAATTRRAAAESVLGSAVVGTAFAGVGRDVAGWWSRRSMDQKREILRLMFDYVELKPRGRGYRVGIPEASLLTPRRSAEAD